MPIENVIQPDIIQIDDQLRLRKYDGNHDFALEWYQDEETLMLVDGAYEPYALDRLGRMYRYLDARGELYFIEVKNEQRHEPVGDVTFWQEDMPIVIGKPEYRGKGIGRKVVTKLVQRAKALGYDTIYVNEIYSYNIGSQKLFTGCGFKEYEKTEKGARYLMKVEHKNMILIENDIIQLRQYTEEDHADMYECWQDIDTQKAYNGRFHQTFEEFCKQTTADFPRFKFWVTVIDKQTGSRMGTLRLGLDETCPDLAIWIYKKYRNQGIGTMAYKLALQYLFDICGYQEISAGCFETNAASQRMLQKIGFIRRADLENDVETDCFTGQPIVQQEYRIQR